MSDRDTLFLNHIIGAIADIEGFIDQQPHEAFLLDRKTQSAVIRQLEIMGEAVKNLSIEFTAGQPSVPRLPVKIGELKQQHMRLGNQATAHGSYGPTQRLGTLKRVNRCGDATAESG